MLGKFRWDPRLSGFHVIARHHPPLILYPKFSVSISQARLSQSGLFQLQTCSYYLISSASLQSPNAVRPSNFQTKLAIAINYHSQSRSNTPQQHSGRHRATAITCQCPTAIRPTTEVTNIFHTISFLPSGTIGYYHGRLEAGVYLSALVRQEHRRRAWTGKMCLSQVVIDY